MEPTRHAEAERLRRVWEDFEPPEGMTAEYFAGQIVMQASPLALHDLVGRSLVRQVNDPYEAWTERGIDLGDDGTPRPDALIIPSGSIPIDHALRDLPTSMLLAVAETVSPSSARLDYGDKPRAYAAHRIPLYLIVDPRDGTWLLHALDPASDTYTEEDRGVFGKRISLLLRTGDRVSIDTTGWYPYPAEVSA